MGSRQRMGGDDHGPGEELSFKTRDRQRQTGLPRQRPLMTFASMGPPPKGPVTETDHPYVDGTRQHIIM